MRYERKYALDAIPEPLIKAQLLQHPAGFRPLFPARQIHNIYFDTPEWTAFRDNEDGNPERVKFRLRWYGEQRQAINHPILEAKSKNGELGKKQHFSLSKSFYLAEDLNGLLQEVQMLTRENGFFHPVLYNTYLRSYWATPNQAFRVTIDSGLAYAPVFSSQLLYTQQQVMEIKYRADQADEAAAIFQYFPFRQTKMSKYALGVQLLWH
ncbi:MAG TPA: polyphosphate polymerase domain-containing protein [Saprospiraceae bacterium]|nr:polyphosphate polymerase domain-containing protein [Saprospiraceae bacterium]HMQ83350.1 polyphosphate polymerase domain-containing protein [Saprospiraceae bacterium]